MLTTDARRVTNQPRAARLAACALVACAALALGACGSGSATGPTTKAGRAARQAADKLDSVRSGKVDATMRATLSFGFEQHFELRENVRFTGAHETELPAYAAEFEVRQSAALGASSNASVPKLAGIVFDGTTLFVRKPGAPAFAAEPAARSALQRATYRSEQQELGAGRIPLLALTPGDWVADAYFAGETTLGGEPVRRVAGTLDLERFFADLRQAKTNQFGFGLRLTGDATKLENGGRRAHVRTKTIELLIGASDGRLRGLRAHVDANVANIPFKDAPSELENELGRVQLELDIDLSELDGPQTIAAPPVS